MPDPHIYTSVGQLLRQRAPGDCCKGLTLPTLLRRVSYLLFRQDKKLKLINRKQCTVDRLSMQFTSLMKESSRENGLVGVGVKVRPVNGKAREIRICFSHNCF